MDNTFVDDSDILSNPEKRSGVEERWASFQPYLLSKGYRLRPRYQPDWVPSWRDTDMDPLVCEDSIDSMPIRVLDAVRVRDERQVIIKMILPSQGREGEEELSVLQYFSTPPLKDDPSNHVVPCLDSFPIPGAGFGHFVVMPLLGQYNEPPFHNLAELHDFLQQLFEGLSFMHKNNVAHRDIALPNVMMDSRALYGEPPHPVRQRLSMDIRRIIYPRYMRLEKHTRYYFIDLGFAKWFRDPTVPRITTGWQARERAPEQRRGEPYNPFLADIYQLGIMLRQDVIPQVNGLRFLNPLAIEMTQTNPMARPSLENARSMMNTAFLGLSGWRYRWPIAPNEVGLRTRLIYVIWGVTSEIQFWLRRILQLFRKRL
ncbi:hypothetical protein CTheo_7704 [Ceratobasidium theobromae]|uniref:Protein kinase domain-containing protein n=1 Tax=Ceratobasidium theobromae TaxID=1582974 RepID=A0A5N5QAN6_9AGAM|nr:hypothetical protein CTheo_7704 [Ceratobasidium theobromae]